MNNPNLLRGIQPPQDDLAFYDWHHMDAGQAYTRGFYQGMSGTGPFGIWQALEIDPTPLNALLVSAWLKGWSKGRQTYLEKHN